MTVPGSIRDVAGAAAFLELSARLGRNPSLVQGPGGNTSIKDAGLLWVKASGTELADAPTRDIFLPVRLTPLLEGIATGDTRCETCAEFVVAELNPARLRPSIETTFHALLPQKIVVHVHCVETIAWACQVDAEKRLAGPLAGLDWAFVPYVKPGLTLSLAMKARMSSTTSVVILGNHGPVVAAETVEAADALLAEVVRRLSRSVQPAPAPDQSRLQAAAEGTSYVAAADSEVHGLATDPLRLAFCARGSLYPDHVIFLGPGVVVLAPGENLADRLADEARPIAPLVLVPGVGALLPRSAGPAANALARCLADMTARLQPGEELVYLRPEDEQALLNWDAEKYRRALANSQVKPA